MRRILQSRSGFTLTELSVLMGVGTILASVLVADLTQTRAKLLQQACAANLKHWGMAFSMYADDFNGTFYYDVSGLHFYESGSPLLSYLGTYTNALTLARATRMCPARVGQVPFGTAGYEMPVGQYRKGLGYANAGISGSPYFRGGNYWPDLKSTAQPAQYLLLIETYNTVFCGGLVNAVTLPAVGTNVDPLPSIARHGGSVNCLFGDFHVELVSSNKIAQQNAISCTSGNPWFQLN